MSPLFAVFVFFCSCFFWSVFWVGEWLNGSLSNVLFTAAVGLQMSGFEPSLFPLFEPFALFSVLFFWWVRGVNYCCCSYSSIFHSIPRYTCFWLFNLPNVWRTFFIGRFSKPENSQKNPGYLRPTVNTFCQVTPRE